MNTVESQNEIDQNAKEGFKKTKLGWIPEDWKVDQLEKYITIRSGNSPSDFNETTEGISFIKVDDLNNSFKYQKRGKFVVDRNKDYVPVNSIIFPKRGAAIMNNKVRISCKKLFMDSNLMAVTPKNEFLDVEYLYYFILQKKLFRIADTSTIPQINNKHINPLKLVLPPLPEQIAIATCLSTWDAAITKLDALIKAKQQIKKALMQQLLSGKKRLPGFEGEWEEKRLDFFFNERNERDNWDLPLLSIGEAGIYPQDDSNKKDTSNSDKSKYKKICVGDIGYNTMRMWQGRSALSGLEGIVSPAYTILKPKRNADSKFFAHLFKDPAIIHRFFRNSQGMVSDTLNCKFKDFAIIKLMLPINKSEQTAIAEILNTADQEIELLTTQLEQFKLQKKGLMQQLLTGKKRLV